MYSRWLIAGGVGTEKKDPVRSTKTTKRNATELMITRLEANLTLILLNRRTIDVKSSARPTKIVVIAM